MSSPSDNIIGTEDSIMTGSISTPFLTLHSNQDNLLCPTG